MHGNKAYGIISYDWMDESSIKENKEEVLFFHLISRDDAC